MEHKLRWATNVFASERVKEVFPPIFGCISTKITASEIRREVGFPVDYEIFCRKCGSRP